jgi:6-pyruvoyl-tetrahydropterin synthase
LFEYEEYRKRKKKLLHLEALCHKIVPDSGLDIELKEDDSNKKLCSLCTSARKKGSDELTVRFLCFPAGESASRMLDEFYIILEEEKPGFFCRLWDERVNTCFSEIENDPQSLTYEDIDERIWQQIYKECEETLQQLSTLKLSLQSVKHYFFERYDGKKHLENDLTKLCIAMNRCNELKPSDNKLPAFEIEWIADAVARIELYKHLCRYATAAEAIIKLRGTLGLTGDFTVVETLSKAAD